MASSNANDANHGVEYGNEANAVDTMARASQEDEDNAASQRGYRTMVAEVYRCCDPADIIDSTALLCHHKNDMILAMPGHSCFFNAPRDDLSEFPTIEMTCETRDRV